MPDDRTRFIGVDWSGARHAPAQRKAIWSAVVQDGGLTYLSSGRSPDEAVAHAIRLAGGPRRTVVGLDFAFSLPRWWLREEDVASADALWEWSAQSAGHAEDWIRDLPEPFWGANFRRRPVERFRGERGEFRRTGDESRRAGATPMSTFRLFGPGTVGAQGLRGHPHLLTLRRAGFAVLPFHDPVPRLVVEVFPRLLVRRLCPAMDSSGDPTMARSERDGHGRGAPLVRPGTTEAPRDGGASGSGDALRGLSPGRRW